MTTHATESNEGPPAKKLRVEEPEQSKMYRVDIGTFAESAAAPPPPPHIQSIQTPHQQQTNYSTIENRTAIFDKADELYRKTNYKAAIQLYSKASSMFINGKGCSQSCHSLYLIYIHGSVVKKDTVMATSYYILCNKYMDLEATNSFIAMLKLL
jgi:TPR repeat protein